MPSTKQRRIQYSQNFLHSRKLVRRLVDQSGITDRDVIIEIGPGKGIITDALAERTQHVLTIEKDPRHAGMMRRRFGDRPNVTVFACDILDFPLPETPYKVFANIPYRLTSAIVGKLTTGVAPPDDIYLTMQREAAERYTGTQGESMVSICLKPWFDIAIAHQFRRRDFVPQPSVESVLLRLRKREHPDIPWCDRARFRQLVEAIFSAWQPTVDRALRKLVARHTYAEVRSRVGDAISVRPSALALSDWITLFEELDKLGDDRTWPSLAAASEELHRQQERLDRPTRTRARPSRRHGGS